MVNIHTQNLIVDNIATILTIAPQAFIRPINNFKTNRFKLERENCHYAHLAITPFTVEKKPDYNDTDYVNSLFAEAPIKEWKEYGQRLDYYVTSSTTEVAGTPYISFRQELIDAWKLKGWANVLWFPKGLDSTYCNLTSEAVRALYHKAGNNKELKDYVSGGCRYVAFPVQDSFFKQKPTTIPENTAFDPKYKECLRYIDNVTYAKHRNIKGNLYVITADKIGNVKKVHTYRSIKEFYEILLQSGFKFKGYKTITRNIMQGQLIQDLDENVVVYATYNENEFKSAQNTIDKLMNNETIQVAADEVTITKPDYEKRLNTEYTEKEIDEYVDSLNVTYNADLDLDPDDAPDHPEDESEIVDWRKGLVEYIRQRTKQIQENQRAKEILKQQKVGLF